MVGGRAVIKVKGHQHRWLAGGYVHSPFFLVGIEPNKFLSLRRSNQYFERHVTRSSLLALGLYDNILCATVNDNSTVLKCTSKCLMGGLSSCIDKMNYKTKLQLVLCVATVLHKLTVNYLCYPNLLNILALVSRQGPHEIAALLFTIFYLFGRGTVQP